MKKLGFSLKRVVITFGFAIGVNFGLSAADATELREISGDWRLVVWEGYVPYGTYTAETENGRVVHHFRDVTAKAGGGITCLEKIPVREGACVKVTFEAKGKGKAAGELHWLSADGQANGGKGMDWFDLTPEWRTYTFSPRVTNGPRDTYSLNYRFNLRPGGDAYVANVRIAVEHSEIEDFDKTSAPLVGDASPEKTDIAPGLLQKTGVGLWKGAERREISFADNLFRMPQFMENPIFDSSVRIYPFGRVTRTSSSLAMAFAGENGRSFRLVIGNDATRGDLDCAFVDEIDGRENRLAAVPVSYASLPADFLLRVHPDGRVKLSVKSLSDGASYELEGKSAFFAGNARPFAASLVFEPSGAESELMLDNYRVGPGDSKTKYTPVPFTVEKLPTFDPVKAGWKLTFSDEFDGERIDPVKWLVRGYEPKGYYSRYRAENAYLKDGLLHIRTDWDEEHKGLATASVWARHEQLYGYFEARLRFTHESGWWSAFWLWSNCGVSNSFVDGFEIDIFEDYYTRTVKPGEPHEGRLDHNIHMSGGGVLKSWNYGSRLPGSLDDFYTLGCKWTPFEISYYLNGKLIASKSPDSSHLSVTFDAITHATGLVPLVPILSGQIMGEGYPARNPEGFSFPEEFLVDWIRVYAYPQEGFPTATLATTPANKFVKTGERMRFVADVKPSLDGAGVKAVYLFDSGYLLDYRTKPPYSFDVTFDESYYSETRWKRPGRSGKKPELVTSGTHAFAAFVLDEKGRYAHSPVVTKLIADLDKSRPYRGVAQKVPGVVKLGLFDEGGEGVAYHDRNPENTADSMFRKDEGVDAWSESLLGYAVTGEWLTYTVDVAEAGDYSVGLTYGMPTENVTHGVELFVDGFAVGRIPCPSYANGTWTLGAVGKLENLKLPAGRHRLTVLIDGNCNFGELTFTRK